MNKKLRGLMLTIMFLLIYYPFFMPFTLTVKDNIVGVMESHNLTKIQVPEKVYNSTTGEWEEKVTEFNFAGFVDLALTIIIVFAPLLVVYKYIFRW